jgi:hypothetical protein
MTRMSECAVEQKVAAIFRELVGERAAALNGARFPANVTSTITAAIIGDDVDEAKLLRADEIAFHLTDWSAEAAFLVALHLFPERFTKKEIQEGVLAFLIRAPNHIVAAARLSGHPVEDIFKKIDESE